MHHIVSFSGGKASFAAAVLVAKRYRDEIRRGPHTEVEDEHGRPQPGHKLTLLFADTTIEDEDLYRFLDEAHAWLADQLRSPDNPNGCELVKLKEGRDPWTVFEDVRFIGNTRIDPCSRILKRETLRRYLEEQAAAPDNSSPDEEQAAAHHSPDESDTTPTVPDHSPVSNLRIYVGIDWTEEHRLAPIVELHKPFEALSPLLEPEFYELLYPAADRRTPSPPGPDECLKILERAGIRQPRLYDLGFSHNNCGGFCIKGGTSAFARLYEHFPERYMEHERREEWMRRHVLGTSQPLDPADPDSPVETIPHSATIMRDRSKGARAASVGLNPDSDLEPLIETDDEGNRVVRSGRYTSRHDGFDPTTGQQLIAAGDEIPRVVPLSMRTLRQRLDAARDAGLDPIEAKIVDPDDEGACSCFAPPADTAGDDMEDEPL